MAELPPLDTEHANAARMYDYFLGGFHNFEADRRAARAAEAARPGVQATARANRSFLWRAVRYLAEECGISQFLDLGSGVPTVGNVHEVAQRINPEARVVYVDNEPVAVQASRKLLEGNPNATIIAADLLDPDVVLDHPETRRLLDLDKPLAVMLVSVLHFVPDQETAVAVTRRYIDAMASGSYLTISHFSDPALVGADPARVEAASDVYRTTTNPATWRTREQIEELFTGVEMVPPGVVHIIEWRADTDPRSLENRDHITMHAGVGRKP
jgi:hypothetical protein